MPMEATSFKANQEPVRWQSGGNVHFCSFGILAKSLKNNSRRGGRVAEGGGLLNRYTV
jgi:hypothetical protein